MNAYETSTTVQEHGQILVAGVPFEPGTRVEITITPIPVEATDDTSASLKRAQRLFAALDKARNTESIGPLRREELYDRKVLR